MKVAVIGGGLAGCAAAYFLKKSGAKPVIFEGGDALAGCASGNDIGLVNPRFTALRTPESDYFTAAFFGAVRFFDGLDSSCEFGATGAAHASVMWNRCGSLHLINDDKKAKRFPQTIENWGWPDDEMRLVSADEASAIAGIDLAYPALYIRSGGYISPKNLCRYYAQGVDVCLNTHITDIEMTGDGFDAVVIACGTASAAFDLSRHIPLQAVRGQVSKVNASPLSEKLRCNLNFGGYLSPCMNVEGRKINMLGATFQRWLSHSDIIDGDDEENIDKLRSVAPHLADDLTLCGHRASVRCASRDHFPVVGALGENGNNLPVYISAAHGSHGIISSFAAANLLCDMILGRPYSQSKYSVMALSPQRFSDKTSA